MELSEIWRNALGELEITLSKANFETWFKNTFIYEFKKGILVIGVPSFFIEDWLKKKYLKEIEKALQNQISEPILTIKFKIASPPKGTITSTTSTPVIRNTVDKSTAQSIPISTSQPTLNNTTLNSNYIFENFIVGQSNQLAFAAAQAVVKQPGNIYNPLYIYGESGLGKTHLMQAIGNAYLNNFPDKKILYVSSETFINDFISAVGSGFGKAKDFKNRYRDVDLLLIDDIQFLSSKEGTQDEFFHTFNHLHQNKKQVVLTSDRSPKDIKGLELRLKTRFEGGMVCDVSLPDLETREAILHQKAKKLNANVPAEVITYIAENIKSSIRELEGALNKIIATCQLTNTEITKEISSQVLGNIISEKKHVITPELIISEVRKYYRIQLDELLGPKRNKELVLPRQITMYLLRHECGLSFPLIGKEMGGKDHSTIMHGCDKIEASISQNARIKEDIMAIKEKLVNN